MACCNASTARRDVRVRSSFHPTTEAQVQNFGQTLANNRVSGNVDEKQQSETVGDERDQEGNHHETHHPAHFDAGDG